MAKQIEDICKSLAPSFEESNDLESVYENMYKKVKLMTNFEDEKFHENYYF